MTSPVLPSLPRALSGLRRAFRGRRRFGKLKVPSPPRGWRRSRKGASSPLSGLFRVLLAFCAVLSGLRSPLSVLTAAADELPPFYRSQFQDGIAERWSASQIRVTPDGKRKFMGEFAKKSNTILRLHGLPPHRLVRVRFNLLLFQGAGESPNAREPDFWSLSDSGGAAFFRSSFEFPRPFQSSQPALPSQSFPDEFPIAHPAGTGAAEQGTLSVNRGNDPDAATDMVYHLEVAFPESEPDLELRFCSEFKNSQPPRTWGIENVTVEAVPNFAERSAAENRKLWDDLIDRNAMDSWNALWQLAEGGPRTTAFVAQQLGAQTAEERALHFVHDLTAGDSLSREKASALIDALASSDFLMLNSALASPETPESLRPKLQKLIEDLAAESPAFMSRVTRLLRVLGAPDAQALLARLESPPPPPADSLLTLAWQRSHAIDENSQAERCAFGPDGKQLFSVSSDGLRVWDVAASKCLRFVSMTNFCSLAISPDGNTVAAGKKGGRVFLWKLPNWDMKQLNGHRGWALGLAFTSDSKRLWTGAFDGIRCWNLDSLQQSQMVAIPTQTRHLCISPDGQILAANQNPYKNQPGCVVMRSVDTGDALRQIGRIRSGPAHAVFSPDGQLLAVAKDNDGTLIYSLETGQKIKQFDSPGPQGQCVEFSPDGKYLCVAGGGGDGVSYLNQRGVHLYRMADGADVWHFTGVTSMNCVAFSHEGARLAAIDDEGRLYLWNVRRDLEAP
jgi:WD40 repeat protein